MRHPGAVQAGTGADQIDRGAVQQLASQGRGRGGIANAHFAADIQLAVRLTSTQGAGLAGVQGKQQLRGAHRRPLQEILRALTYMQMTHTTQRFQRCGGAQVDHVQGRAQLPRQDADGRAAADEIAQHLPGDFLGKG